MNSKPKSFWCFYILIALTLAGAAALPIRNFGVMISIIYRAIVFELPALFSVSSIIPFMAVLTAILIGFLFLPVLWKLPASKRCVFVSVGAVVIFVALGLFVEMLSLNLDAIPAVVRNSEERSPEALHDYELIPAVPEVILPVLPTRSGAYVVVLSDGERVLAWPDGGRLFLSPDGERVLVLPDGERILLLPGELGGLVLSDAVPAVPDVIIPVVMSRRDGIAFLLPNGEAIPARMHIPWAVRLHYYIFSVVFILAVLNFLYGLANTLYGDGKPGKRVVILHGIATACYALAYFFVRVMQYENHSMLLLTWDSVLNAAICFILAAIVIGLYCGSFMRYEGWGKIIPPAASALTVLALYGAQYAMLGGRFYLYSESAAINIFLRILIVAIPSIAVHFLLRKCEKNERSHCRLKVRLR